MPFYNVTLKAPLETEQRNKLLKYLMKTGKEDGVIRNAKDALTIVREIESGSKNKFFFAFQIYEGETLPEELIPLNFVLIEDDWEREARLEREKREKEWCELSALLKKGAQGDAISAIEYCKKMLEGNYFQTAAGC